jgi:hypothetical protein
MPDISGGDKLQAALDKIARKLKKGGTVKVGFLEGATYPDGTSVPLVAAINEFGAPSRGQPPRPFFRNMIAAKSGEWPKAIEGLLIANDYDARRTLELTGAAIAGQLRQSIVDLVDPPLAPSTIARKGSSKPLIDTGVMLQSVDFEVEEDQ